MVELPRTLLKDFAGLSTGVIKDATNAKYVRGTVKVVGEKKYVLIDGASTTTPIAEVVDVDEGDRVLVSIQNHTATILGNFTFPPSARKEQEAIDKAEDAQTAADGAQDDANAAILAAQSAKENADKAMEDATEASSVAANAKEEAADALLAAQTAGQNATEAKTQAAQAASDASTAVSEAAKAQSAVANANAEMDKINKDVETVKGSVQDALTQVGQQATEMETIKSTLQTDYAKKTEVSEVEASLSSEITQKVGELQATVEQNYAGKTDLTTLEGKLQTQITQNAEGLTSQATKIEKIESDTTEAKKDVDEALEKAGLAQTAASAAQTAASAAQTAADQAKANAATADSKAQAAQTAADAAQAKADAADKAVQTAQSDLDEAKKNLTSVTSRVDATEEEIAEAQQKVDEAQTAVNTALADAAEANLAAANATAAANQAKQDAATAQQVASTAQSKADNAQAAADKAQEDADQALKDVAALTSRVTAAETSITQNAEQIELAASKTEEIGTKLDNMEIGGRNYIVSSELEGGSSNGITVEINGPEVHIYGTNTKKDVGYGVSGARWVFANNNRIPIINGDVWTFSTDTPLPAGVYMQTNILYNNGVSGSIFRLEGPAKKSTITVKNVDENEQFRIQQGFFGIKPSVTDIDVKFRIKLERGDKATDWTPAPEDIENELKNNYYSKTETDAKIQVESDRITQTVTKVETVETALNDLEIGGRNYILDSKNLENTDHLDSVAGSAKEYMNVNVGQSYMDIPDGTKVVISFDLTMQVNSVTGDSPHIMVYNTNSKGPKQIDTRNIYIKRDYVNDVKVGDTISFRVIVQTEVFDRDESEVTLSDNYIEFYSGYGTSNWFKIENLKLEIGNKATDWTPAPEDMATTGDIEGVQESITGIDERVTESESEIEQLANSISMMVTDENGQSLMEQTSEGWTFNIGAIQSQIDEATAGLDTVEKNLNSTTDMVNKANDLLDDVTQKTAYINMATDDSGAPCIELGKQGNPFKLRITNTSIDFMQDNMRIAYITNRQLYIEKSVVTDEMKVGSTSGFIWKKRANGNMGLRWVGE